MPATFVKRSVASGWGDLCYVKSRNPFNWIWLQSSVKVIFDPVDNREVVSLRNFRSSQVFGLVADLPGIRIQDKWHLKVELTEIGDCEGGTTLGVRDNPFSL